MAFFPNPDTFFSAIGVEPSDLIKDRIVEIDGGVLRKLVSMALVSVPIDEQAYLRYPDLAKAHSAGDITDLNRHYAVSGFFEKRFAPPADFDASWYLDQYVDVQLGVQTGAVASALSHYLEVGVREWRVPSAGAKADVTDWFNLLCP